VDVCQPESGDVVCKIKLDEQRSRVGLIEVKRNIIYALSGKGTSTLCGTRVPRLDQTS
jgi:hypothetical protein